MNLVAELQYLYDKLAKVDVAKSNHYLLDGLRLLISQPNHIGYRHGFEYELDHCQEVARINRHGKCIELQCKDIDIFHYASEFYYATMLTYIAIGTKQEANVAKNQGVRIEKAKKVLDLL